MLIATKLRRVTCPLFDIKQSEVSGAQGEQGVCGSKNGVHRPGGRRAVTGEPQERGILFLTFELAVQSMTL